MKPSPICKGKCREQNTTIIQGSNATNTNLIYMCVGSEIRTVSCGWADINLMETINVLLFLAEIHVVPVLWNIFIVLAVLSILSQGWK